MEKERIAIIFLAGFLAVSMMAGCGSQPADTVKDTLTGLEQEENMQIHPVPQEAEVEDMQTGHGADASYTTDTSISDVTGDPVFGDYGRLIFPADAGYYSGDTLGSLCLTWYSNIFIPMRKRRLTLQKKIPGYSSLKAIRVKSLR